MKQTIRILVAGHNGRPLGKQVLAEVIGKFAVHANGLVGDPAEFKHTVMHIRTGRGVCAFSKRKQAVIAARYLDKQSGWGFARASLVTNNARRSRILRLQVEAAIRVATEAAK